MAGYGYKVCPVCCLPRPDRLFDGYPACELCRIKTRISKMQRRVAEIHGQLERAEEAYRAARECAGEKG